MKDARNTAPVPAYMPVSLAPSSLSQSILPWTWAPQFTGLEFGQVTVYVGQSSNPDMEREILDRVGSYGRQLGQIGDALAVIMKRIDLAGLGEEDQDAIDELKAQLAAVGRIKRRAARERAGDQ